MLKRQTAGLKNLNTEDIHRVGLRENFNVVDRVLLAEAFENYSEFTTYIADRLLFSMRNCLCVCHRANAKTL